MHANNYNQKNHYMKNKLLLCLSILLMFITGAKAQSNEFIGKYFASVSEATTLNNGQWYLLYNRGRQAYDYEKTGNSIYQSNKGPKAADQVTADNVDFLLQLVTVEGGSANQYYIKTAGGNWWCDITAQNQAVKTSADQSQRGIFTIAKCANTSGHWYIKSQGGYVVDGQGNNNPAVGWGTSAPSSANGNDDHAFYAVTVGTEADFKGIALVSSQLKRGGIFRFTSQRTTSKSITDPTDHKVSSQTTKTTDEKQWWLLQPLASGGYTMRNYATGNYMQNTSGTSARYTTAPGFSTVYAKVSANATDAKPFVTIGSTADFSGKSCLHDDASNNVVNWLAGSDGGNPASDWAITEVTTVDAATVQAHFNEFDGYLAPDNNLTVQILNVATRRALCEDASGNMISQIPNDDDYSQYWVMERQADGKYAFRNIKSGKYFGYKAGSGTAQTTSASKNATYSISQSTDIWQRTYLIGSADGSQYYNNSKTNTIINSTATDPASTWVFVKADINAEELEEAQLAYQAYQQINSSLSTYTTKLNQFFTDGSCSVLKDTYQAMNDNALRQEFTNAGLPEYLVRIALKIKNNTWDKEDEMSKHFRVNKYQVYSHNVGAKNITGTGMVYATLSNPTGISVKAGDILTVFCDRAAPTGCELSLDIVEGCETGGDDLRSLKQGINVFSFNSDAMVYVFYQLKDMSLKTKLASCPDVCVHFEGGRLDGYYDKTRGHNNATYKHLRDNLLKYSRIMNVKTDKMVFCVKRDVTLEACKTDMELVIKVWDEMIEAQDNLMGCNDTYIPGLSEVQRNVYNFYSTDTYPGGWMNTGAKGVKCMDSAIAAFMNPNEMSKGGIWGPAHECGHLRQYLIQMLGTLESSNNLFANVAVYNQGYTTHRGADPAGIFDKFANKKRWVDYSGWETTHMFYQLFLYFHANNIMPDFYPKVYAKMKKDPMDKSNRTNVRGSNEYLKLARAFCDVAEADLSEFFAMYGFFVPITNFSIDENGYYVMSTTQAEIDETIEYMHRYPKKLGNLLFIDDRIEPVLATYEGHAPGEFKVRRDDDDLPKDKKAGDVGQYTTYVETPSLTGAYYETSASGEVTVSITGSTGLVGFKVYDAKGNLAYAANTYKFTLPTSLRGTKFKLVAAMGDGSDIELSTDIPTSINSTEAEAISNNEPMYDLQGRPTTSGASNIVVKNGKKFMHK